MVKQEDRRAATRDGILAAALVKFGADGFAATSVDDVAALAGVAKGAVYHHFPTKAALFEAVVDLVSKGAVNDVLAASANAADFWSAVKSATGAFFTTCADPAAARILVQDGPAVLGWATWRQIDERNFGGLLEQAFAAAIENGTLATHDPRQMTRIVLASVTQGVIDAAISSDFTAVRAQYVELISDMIMGWANDA